MFWRRREKLIIACVVMVFLLSVYNMMAPFYTISASENKLQKEDVIKVNVQLTIKETPDEKRLLAALAALGVIPDSDKSVRAPMDSARASEAWAKSPTIALASTATAKKSGFAAPTRAVVDQSRAEIHGLRPDVYDHFKERELSVSDKDIFLDLLKTFIAKAEENQWTYFIEGGTLLGSVRNWGFIPWDDDVDIGIVDESITPELRDIFRELEPEYFVRDNGDPDDTVLRLYSSRSHTCVRGDCLYKWPCIDLLFYVQDQHKIWYNQRYLSRYKHKKIDIFPLHRRPFEGLMVNAPKCSFAYFRKFYDPHACATSDSSHKDPFLRRRKVSLNCEMLSKVYPFVSRRWMDGKMEETLKIGGKTLEVRLAEETVLC